MLVLDENSNSKFSHSVYKKFGNSIHFARVKQAFDVFLNDDMPLRFIEFSQISLDTLKQRIPAFDTDDGSIEKLRHGDLPRPHNGDPFDPTKHQFNVSLNIYRNDFKSNTHAYLIELILTLYGLAFGLDPLHISV